MREYFTFYRSYWECINILPEEHRLAVFAAIVGYALDGKLPDEKIDGVPGAIFSLVKPSLDNARRKALEGNAREAKPINLKFTAADLAALSDAHAE